MSHFCLFQLRSFRTNIGKIISFSRMVSGVLTKSIGNELWGTEDHNNLIDTMRPQMAYVYPVAPEDGTGAALREKIKFRNILPQKTQISELKN